MNAWLIIVFCPLFFLQESRVVTGTVTFDNEPLAGCQVYVMPGEGQLTDVDGRFYIAVHNGRSDLTLIVSCLDSISIKTIVENIQISSDTVDVGSVPVFLNKSISISDYEALDAVAKANYKAIYHWNQLLGFFSRNEMDTSSIDEAFVHAAYRYDKATNTVRFDQSMMINERERR